MAREVLQARFTYILLLDQEGQFSRVAHAGIAPRLLNFLTKSLGEDYAVRAALSAFDPFRIRDVRNI